MLRHKAMVQTGRYAFSLTGIYDPDEAARIIEARNGNASPPAPQTRHELRLPPAPPPAPPKAVTPPPPAQSPGSFDFDAFRAELQKTTTMDEANAAFDAWIVPREKHMSSDELDEAQAILREVCEPFFTGDGQ